MEFYMEPAKMEKLGELFLSDIALGQCQNIGLFVMIAYESYLTS